MTARVRLAIKRLEAELQITESRTMGSQFALFLEDLAVLLQYTKKKKGNRHV